MTSFAQILKGIVVARHHFLFEYKNTTRKSANCPTRKKQIKILPHQIFSFIHLAVGFNVETVTFNNLKLQVWDLGGQTGLRPYWRCYYQDTNAVVFVIDSADRERLEIAKQELDLMLQEEELRGAPVLILANK